MKTPDEIKKGLECCLIVKDCEWNTGCVRHLMEHSREYIRQLEKRLADVNASPFDGSMSQAEYFGNQSGLITGWNYPAGHDGRYYGATCSVCNRFVRQPGVLLRYCPLCGAKKEGGADG